MAKKLIAPGLLLAAFLLQYGPVQHLKVFSFTANLCVLALVGVSFFTPPACVAVYGAALGLLMDGAVGRGFGFQLLLCMYLAVAVKIFTNEKINNSPALMAMCVWPYTFVYYIAYGLFSGAVPGGAVPVGRWLLTAAVTSTVNMIVSLPLLWAAERLMRRRVGGE